MHDLAHWPTQTPHGSKQVPPSKLPSSAAEEDSMDPWMLRKVPPLPYSPY